MPRARGGQPVRLQRRLRCPPRPSPTAALRLPEQLSHDDRLRVVALASCPGLRHLDLSYNHKITDAGAGALAAFPALEAVGLACCNLGPAAVSALAASRTLRTIDLRMVDSLTMEDAAALDAAGSATASSPTRHHCESCGCHRDSFA